jgi:hypothetical protein
MHVRRHAERGGHGAVGDEPCGLVEGHCVVVGRDLDARVTSTLRRFGEVVQQGSGDAVSPPVRVDEEIVELGNVGIDGPERCEAHDEPVNDRDPRPFVVEHCNVELEQLWVRQEVGSITFV